MSPKNCAYIVERLAIRFMAMVADHSRQLAEHRAAFGARTEADAKIIAGLRSEIGAARMAVLERDSLMSERTKLQAMVKEQSDSAKAAGELLGWTANESPIQAVERVVRERDGLLTQVQDMRAEMERLREDERKAYQAGDALRAEVAQLKTQLNSPTPKHPVKVGEWVRRTKLPGDQSPVGIVKQVTSIRCYGYSYGFADRDCWSSDNCEPCDPPEATHDTEAGKAAAEAALTTEPVAEEIKVGDVVEVVSNTGLNTWIADVGSVGTVTSIETLEDSLSVRLKAVPDKKNACGGYVSICDVRKVTT